MSLNWNVSNVKDHATKCFVMQEVDGKQERHVNPITYAIIWLSIPIGFREITEKNAKSLFRRIYAYERTFGSMNNKWVDEKPVPVYVDYEQVREHIGLTTNGSNLTEAEFKKQLLDRLLREKYREAEKEIANVGG